MNINRFFIYIAVLVLGITGVSGAAGISAKACSSVPVLSIAQGARSENAAAWRSIITSARIRTDSIRLKRTARCRRTALM